MCAEQSLSLDAWVGRSIELTDVVTTAPVSLMRATLDYPQVTGSTDLPPLWHWLYFLPQARQSDIGADGHPRRGGFLPPIALPRRMWAGSRLEFLRPIEVGAAVRRLSTIKSIQEKSGRSGNLIFVTVQHDASDAYGVAGREEQDIVYRDALAVAAPSGTSNVQPKPIKWDPQFSRTIIPDPVLLMRYSALTFNGHRIHYDRPYAMQEEGYPGLVVHGPLIATLLLEELRSTHSEKSIRSFDFKAVSPLFDTAPFKVNVRVDGDTARLWATGTEGQLAMQAGAVMN
ncbi:acyl-CoA dehydrogenase [Diaphorobacter sp. HDW4A]|uniref:FAS1-like dehydratase domain-containing protein n=1 Tax=Diaphorobacter sp. HDW4A TaxID=2714924 RepID=UPI00140C0AE6|nr:MaoC family dehydratase N-terminal domain-containing protein [Diaphorobacter sp. HDW4A]QIL79956.1 acyl-CoA dehydrogenase [Diaphorobacter sp. HDW4A]